MGFNTNMNIDALLARTKDLQFLIGRPLLTQPAVNGWKSR
jgi:hypothetical protein